jgi:flagellar basal body-associated protein FliL
LYWILITIFIVFAVLLVVVSISMSSSSSNDLEEARRYYEPQDVEIVER